MQNKKIKISEIKPIPLWLTSTILIAVSILFFSIGLIVTNNTNKNKQFYKETIATIVYIDTYDEIEEKNDGTIVSTTTHDVYINYSVDGVDYENIKTNFYKQGMYVGQEITVTYDSRNPSKIILDTKTSSIICIIIFIVSSLLFVATICGTIKALIDREKYKEFVNNILTTGLVKRAVIHFIYSTQHRSHFICYIDGHEYSSEEFKFNPDLYTGCTVNIYFEKEGYEERKQNGLIQIYYIDINSIETGEPIEPYIEP
ncbi:MAG: DUF3592 domain-containing protein [Christensenellales bacterium]